MHADNAEARSKKISQLEAGSEFTERCDAGEPRLGIPYSEFLSQEKTHEFRVAVAIRESFLREIYGSSRVVRLCQTTQNHGKAIIAENCSLVQA